MNSATSNSLSPLYQRPGFLLRRAHQISAALFETECKSVGLTPAQFGMLTVLKASPGLDQTSLARAMGFDKVTVLRVLRGLEARGLVSRTTAPKGRRSVSVLLTPSGQDLLQSAQKPAEQAYARLMAPLSEPEQAQFIQLLTRLTTELETDARAPWVPL